MSSVPKQYLCPICGKWHNWPNKAIPFDGYDDRPVKLECAEQSLYTPVNEYYYQGSISYYFKNGLFRYEIQKACSHGNDGRVVIKGWLKSSGIYSNFKLNNYKECHILIPTDWLVLGEIRYPENNHIDLAFRF